MEILDHASYDNTQASFTKAIKEYLTASAKWGKFMAIAGFIMWGLMMVAILEATTSIPIISAIVPGTNLMFNGGGFINFLLVVFFISGFFPIWYLYKFSNQTLKSIPTMHSKGIEEALENLKSLFKFYGVYIAVILGIYTFIILIGLVDGWIK